ncbi:unnamed protein product [Zymoseptoria tritici ST99CH_1E4]|uniref:Uncharacterized protein n=1 Tax=Zymoseptoria tritici ST99CH_1E4 TaxID=1276532 RepID=A0A2H1GP07_ZYMTR|nr:unnamed protein product [Zymoseptoria tritici ST99CH_1E4]
MEPQDDIENFESSRPSETAGELQNIEPEEDAISAPLGIADRLPTDSGEEQSAEGDRSGEDSDDEDPFGDLERAVELPNTPSVPMLSTLPNAPLPLPDLDLVAGYEAMMARPPREPRKPKATGDDSDGSEEKKEKKKRTPNTGVKSTPWTDREDLILLKIYRDYAGRTHLQMAALHNAIYWPHVARPQRSEHSVVQQIGRFTKISQITGPPTRDHSRIPAHIAAVEARLNGFLLPAGTPLVFVPKARGAGGTMAPHAGAQAPAQAMGEGEGVESEEGGGENDAEGSSNRGDHGNEENTVLSGPKSISEKKKAVDGAKATTPAEDAPKPTGPERPGSAAYAALGMRPGEDAYLDFLVARRNQQGYQAVSPNWRDADGLRPIPPAPSPFGSTSNADDPPPQSPSTKRKATDDGNEDMSADDVHVSKKAKNHSNDAPTNATATESTSTRISENVEPTGVDPSSTPTTSKND